MSLKKLTDEQLTDEKISEVVLTGIYSSKYYELIEKMNLIKQEANGQEKIDEVMKQFILNLKRTYEFETRVAEAIKAYIYNFAPVFFQTKL